MVAVGEVATGSSRDGSSGGPLEALVGACAEPAALLREGRVLLGNEALARLLGREVHGVAFAELASPEDRGALEVQLEAAARGRGAGFAPRLLLCRGAPREVEVMATAVPVAEGSLLFVLLRPLDAVAQARELELRRTRRQLDTVERLARMGSWWWDPETAAIRWSAQMFELCGITPEQLPIVTEASCLDFIDPDDRPRVARIVQQARERGVSEPFEFRLVMPDGSRRWVRGLDEQQLDPSGRRDVFGFMQDITAERAAAVRLEGQLEENRVLLRELQHRVKNNLQAVTSLLALQRRNAPTEEAARALDDSARRVEAVLLVHRRLSSEGLHPRVELGGFARELVAALVDAYGVDQRRVAVEVEGGGVSLHVERAVPCGLWLHEVLSNAIKHAFPERRSGRIVVSVGSAEGRGVVVVRDDGVGFADSGSRSASGRGTLGLELLPALVSQMGAHVSRLPPPGTGYRLELPLDAEPLP